MAGPPQQRRLREQIAVDMSKQFSDRPHAAVCLPSFVGTWVPAADRLASLTDLMTGMHEFLQSLLVHDLWPMVNVSHRQSQ